MRFEKAIESYHYQVYVVKQQKERQTRAKIYKTLH